MNKVLSYLFALSIDEWSVALPPLLNKYWIYIWKVEGHKIKFPFMNFHDDLT
jgi:hypothetical protein